MQILCKWARRNSIWCHNVCSFRREKEAQTIKRVSRRNANGEMSLVNCWWRGGAVRERHGREMRRFVCLAVLFLVVTRLVWKGNWCMTFDSDSTRVVCCSAANMADCLSGCQLTEMAANTGKKKGKYRNLRGFICPETLPKTSATVRHKEHNRRFFISFLPADNLVPV